MNQIQSDAKCDSNRVTEYAKERIKQIKLIQKDLDNLKNRLKKNECFPKDEILNSLARNDARLALGTAINLLQDLCSVYEREYYKGNQ